MANLNIPSPVFTVPITLSPWSINIIGSSGDDNITLLSPESVNAEAGNNIINGGTVGGSAGYWDDPTAINANFSTGIVLNGFGGKDTLINIYGISTPSISSSLIVGSNGGDCQADSGPVGTTSVWPAKTRCGAPSPILAKRLSTSGVPGSVKILRMQVKPPAVRNCCSTSSAPASAGVTEGQRIRSRARAVEGERDMQPLTVVAKAICRSRH